MTIEPSADETLPGAGAPSPPVVVPPLVASGDVPPPLPKPIAAGPKASSGRQALAAGLNLCLGLFLADALFSIVNDSLAVLFGFHALASFGALISVFSLLVGLVVYLLMGITPMIPKRAFLPVTIFGPLMILLVPLVLIYFPKSVQLGDLISSCFQLVLGLTAWRWLRGGLGFGWPPVTADRLGTRIFSGVNLTVFLVINVVVLPVVVLVYLFWCASLAVNHETEGFLTLGPGGVTVQAREYVRDDGKKVLLVPMVHIGDANFYDKVSQSFPTNSVILMEGVTDENNLITNTISYHRAARSVGLAEQQMVFHPTRGRRVRADVDVKEFTPGTISMLNLGMLIHSKGLNADTIRTLLQYSPPPDYDKLLLADLVEKRNQSVLREMRKRLSRWDYIVVPWGAAHIPGIAKGVQKEGFHLKDAHEYQVIRFGPRRHERDSAEAETNSATPK